MRFFCVVMLTLLAAAMAAEAKTIDLAGQQAHVDVPDTWSAQPGPADGNQSTSALILSAISAEKNSLLQIQVCSNPRGLLASQPDLVANTKDAISNQILSRGGQIQVTSETATSLNAVPAYLIQYTETTSASKQIQTRFYQVAANGKLYQITLRTVDAAADADLQSIASSFRFDVPPSLPVPQAPVHRIRYFLMAGAGVLLLVGLGFAFYWHRQRQIYE